MRRRTMLFGALSGAALLLLPKESPARPGGGSSFKGSSSSGSRSSSSGSSSRSSSSGSGSRSSSFGSSNSGSRSSSGSSDRSYSTPTYVAPRTPKWATRNGDPSVSAKIASSPLDSVYPRPSPHDAIPIAPDTTPVAQRVGGFVFGAGAFAVFAAFVATPFALVGGVIRRIRNGSGRNASWSSNAFQPSPVVEAPAEEPNPAVLRQRMISTITKHDHDFSMTIFEDFVAALYTEAHVARGTQALEKYSPYLRPGARQTLASLRRVPVTAVIVGAMRPTHFQRDRQAGLHRVIVEIESNLTEDPEGANPQAYYARERWSFCRAIGARSRPPGRARALVCPNCGAPLEKTVHGRCTHCSQAVDSGQFDWVVERINILERETRGPMLTGTTEEQGTTHATIFDPHLGQWLQTLFAADPSFTRESIERRVGVVFSTMQQAWSSLEWRRARPCLTDRLWNAQTYWIEAYRQQGLRNITENARITKLEVVRASQDRWYQSVTVRIHATGLDYTLRVNDSSVVGGSRSKERPYTEYWTLVRTKERRGPEDKPACPSCGAPLPLEMTEKCMYCNALVDASVFDWVLSRIEQDDVYVG